MKPPFWSRVLPAALLLICGASFATDQDPAPKPDELLQKIYQAARGLDYAGIIVQQQGSAVQASLLAHLLDGTGERVRMVSLDGNKRECLRESGFETCFYPAHKLRVKRMDLGTYFPALVLGERTDIAASYEISADLGLERYAGRECRVSELRARDALRYSQRICTDTENDLLLHQQTIDEHGQVLNQQGFVSLELGADAANTHLQTDIDSDKWRELTEAKQESDLEQRGWRFALPPGFSALVQIARAADEKHQVDQLVVSDGIAAISIFIETFDPKRDQSFRQGGIMQNGLSIYRSRMASFWITAVGEVPLQTLQEMLQAIQLNTP